MTSNPAVSIENVRFSIHKDCLSGDGGCVQIGGMKLVLIEASETCRKGEIIFIFTESLFLTWPHSTTNECHIELTGTLKC